MVFFIESVNLLYVSTVSSFLNQDLTLLTRPLLLAVSTNENVYSQPRSYVSKSNSTAFTKASALSTLSLCLNFNAKELTVFTITSSN